MDIRLESIRKTVKAIPGVAKLFVKLLKNDNKEVVTTAAKFLENITEGSSTNVKWM